MTVFTILAADFLEPVLNYETTVVHSEILGVPGETAMTCTRSSLKR